MTMHLKTVVHMLIAAMLGLCLPLSVQSQTSASSGGITFEERIPLGISGFVLSPTRRSLYVMSTADSPSFSGWRLEGEGPGRTVLDRDGSPVRHFPTHIQFRVTATLAGNDFAVDRDRLDLNTDLNQFMLNLHFRLKVFHGLSITAVEPDTVEMIGMPADVPYDERVYRAFFTLPPVPIEDRLVLEVLTPNGDRLCKFHLEF